MEEKGQTSEILSSLPLSSCWSRNRRLISDRELPASIVGNFLENDSGFLPCNLYLGIRDRYICNSEDCRKGGKLTSRTS